VTKAAQEVAMRGQILGVDVRTGEGQLAGDDGRRYRFRPDDWAHQGEPAIGLHVDFEPESDRARSIFPLPGAQTLPATAERQAVASGRGARRGSDKSRLVAALLAFFLGVLGIHRFYLGRNGSAIVMLLLTLTAVGTVVSIPWALLDTVRYLLMSDNEFANRYASD
jgi:TM2 domain-containing membrane protein YozV